MHCSCLHALLSVYCPANYPTRSRRGYLATEGRRRRSCGQSSKGDTKGQIPDTELKRVQPTSLSVWWQVSEVFIQSFLRSASRRCHTRFPSLRPTVRGLRTPLIPPPPLKGGGTFKRGVVGSCRGLEGCACILGSNPVTLTLPFKMDLKSFALKRLVLPKLTACL